MGYGTLLIRGNGNGQTLPGVANRGGQSFSGLQAGPVAFEVTLDATDPEPSNWTVAWFGEDADGDTMSRGPTSVSLGSYGQITHSGFSRNGPAQGTVDNLKLPPDPGALTLLGLAGLVMVCRRRRD